MIYMKDSRYKPVADAFDQAEQREWDQTKRYSNFDRWFLTSCGISFNGDVRGLEEWARENNFLQEDTTMETLPKRKAPKLEAAKIEVKRLWRLMCIADNVGTDSKFVTFSPSNPHAVAYNSAIRVYQRLLKAQQARAARRDAITSLGMREVRGAQGGRYIE